MHVRQAAERVAVNMPIQGTAADIMKLAMIRVYNRMHSEGMRSLMLLQVHDELLFETPKEEDWGADGDGAGGDAPGPGDVGTP